MTAYYNEIDPRAAATLKQLICEGIIADGDVDDRSIEDVRPNELLGYTQCHFFAGAGIWSYSARRAGWPDIRPLWTGSCPCQPFSAAGKGDGFADERHLWPAFFHLIQHGKPENVPVLGEQVASKDGLAWLDLVQADLEGAGHSCWPYDICAAGFGAPIIRQRLFWVASAASSRCRSGLCDCRQAGIGGDQFADGCGSSGMVRSFQSRLEGHGGNVDRGQESGRIESQPLGSNPTAGAVGRMGGAEGRGCGIGRDAAQPRGGAYADCADGTRGSGPTNGFWRDVDWLYCRDDKWRPVEPGAFVLAHGYPERTGLLRLAGNAINAEVATAFIEEVMKVLA